MTRRRTLLRQSLRRHCGLAQPRDGVGHGAGCGRQAQAVGKADAAEGTRATQPAVCTQRRMRRATRCAWFELSLRLLCSSCNARWRKTAQQSPRRCRCAPAAASREQPPRSKAAAVAQRLCCGADPPAARRAGRARHIRALGCACGGRNATVVRRSATATCRPCPCACGGAHRVSPARRSTVIMEDDPKPGALLGRMSFRRAPAMLSARVRMCIGAEACVTRAETTTRRRRSCMQRWKLAPPKRPVRSCGVAQRQACS